MLNLSHLPRSRTTLRSTVVPEYYETDCENRKWTVDEFTFWLA